MAASTSMVITNLHLRPEQKRLMQARAKKRGTNLAEEMRAAVDAYLNGVSSEELALLDTASKATEIMFKEMTETLAATNAKADKIFKALASLQQQAGA